MSERCVLQCECGYEKIVAVSLLGTPIACDNCGADLSAVRPSAAPAAAAEPVQTAPPRAPSPFEEAEEDVPSAEMSQKAAPASARSRSAFEEPGETHDDEAPWLAVRGPDDKRRVASPGAAAVQDRCGRCGKAFRGAWDRIESANDVICYNCANLAIEGTPERLKGQVAIGPVEPPTPMKIGSANPPKANRFLGFDTSSREFKIGLVFFGLAVLGLAIYFFVGVVYGPVIDNGDL